VSAHDFPNLYADMAEAVVGKLCHKSPGDIERPFPTVEDGVKGLACVEAAVRSSASGRWEPLEYPPCDGRAGRQQKARSIGRSKLIQRADWTKVVRPCL
jgi:hypothetical protein